MRAKRVGRGDVKPAPIRRERPLATFRRKIDGFVDFDRWRDAKRSPYLQDARSRAQTYGTDCFAIARPMLMRLSAITPRPTQRFMPASPL
jgi:hypothetical protein